MVHTFLIATCVSLVVQRPLGDGKSARPVSMQLFSAKEPKRLLVLGGGGFVGSEVCKNAVDCGYTVTSLTRRGENPDPKDARLTQVTWLSGDATDAKTVTSLVNNADAVVHAVGLLFDVNSGLQGLSPVVSGSNSKPTADSTYDNITRRTALNAIAAAKTKSQMASMLGGAPFPFVFVSCAEAGWPDVQFGKEVDAAAPKWLQEYLVAKRAVEAELGRSSSLRPVILRPSLIWNWGKLDVLPIIPLFNLANALGVPFIDKTVRVETLAKAAVAGVRDSSVRGVQRFGEMEALASLL